MPRERAPRLPAYTLPDGGLAVWCDYCTVWHTHSGGVGEDDGVHEVDDGYRRPHCGVRIGNKVRPHDLSPYVATGYVLNVVGPAPDWLLRDYRRGLSVQQGPPR